MESIVYMPTWANVIFVCAIVLLIIVLLWKNIQALAAKVKNIPLEFESSSIQETEDEINDEGQNVLKIREIAINKHGWDWMNKNYWSKTIVFSDGGCVEAPYEAHSEWRTAKKGDKVIKQGKNYRPL
mgnify:CR=1 FL=1